MLPFLLIEMQRPVLLYILFFRSFVCFLLFVFGLIQQYNNNNSSSLTKQFLFLVLYIRKIWSEKKAFACSFYIQWKPNANCANLFMCIRVIQSVRPTPYYCYFDIVIWAFRFSITLFQTISLLYIRNSIWSFA